MAGAADINDSDHSPRTVGRRLKALYLAKGWKANTFAGMLGHGMTPQKLSNYESGANMLPVDVAIRAGNLTGADLLYIYQGRLHNLEPTFAVKVSEKLAELMQKKPQPMVPQKRTRRTRA